MEVRHELPDHAPHVLVVDDDRRLRDLLSRFLWRARYRVTTAARRRRRRAKRRELVFDALVLDVMMPGESGFDFARRIRTTRACDPPCWTPPRRPGDRVTGLEIGAGRLPAAAFRAARVILRLGNILQRAAPGPPDPPAPRHPLRPFAFRSTGRAAPRATRCRITERSARSDHPGRGRERPAEARRGGGAPNERTVDVQINPPAAQDRGGPRTDVLQTVGASAIGSSRSMNLAQVLRRGPRPHRPVSAWSALFAEGPLCALALIVIAPVVLLPISRRPYVFMGGTGRP
jgi:two-component system phosphate regulon response regulator OmpR